MIPLPVIDSDIYLVGLCSETGPGSGKSYIADKLVQQLNSRTDDTYAYRASFAGLLKKFTGRVVSMDATSTEFKSSYMILGDAEELTGRDLLIRMGEAARDIFGPNFWIEQLANQVEDKYEAQLGRERGKVKAIVVVDDVRYKNEAEWIRSNNGFMLNVTNPNHNPIFPTRDSGDVCFKGMTKCVNDKQAGDSKLNTVLNGLAAGILIMADIKRKAL